MFTLIREWVVMVAQGRAGTYKSSDDEVSDESSLFLILVTLQLIYIDQPTVLRKISDLLHHVFVDP